MTIKERAETVVGEIRFSSSLTSDASVIERAITEAVREHNEECVNAVIMIRDEITTTMEDAIEAIRARKP